MRKSCFPDNTHLLVLRRRRLPSARHILSDLRLRCLLFHFCHNTCNMTSLQPCKMEPGHDDSGPQALHPGENQRTHPVGASSLLLPFTPRACSGVLMLQQHDRINTCDCCFETVSSKKTVQLPGCGHTYCADCLRVIYRMAIENEADFPPSCCSGAINIESVKHLLHRPQIRAFEKIALEYSTPKLDRRYCADTRCNSF